MEKSEKVAAIDVRTDSSWLYDPRWRTHKWQWQPARGVRTRPYIGQTAWAICEACFKVFEYIQPSWSQPYRYCSKSCCGKHLPARKATQYKKGRPGRPGSSHYMSKLKEADVIVILQSDQPHRVLAKAFKVDKSAITKIKNGTRWSHMPREKELP